MKHVPKILVGLSILGILMFTYSVVMDIYKDIKLTPSQRLENNTRWAIKELAKSKNADLIVFMDRTSKFVVTPPTNGMMALLGSDDKITAENVTNIAAQLYSVVPSIENSTYNWNCAKFVQLRCQQTNTVSILNPVK